jgi:hypothetical protein
MRHPGPWKSGHGVCLPDGAGTFNQVRINPKDIYYQFAEVLSSSIRRILVFVFMDAN